MDELANEEVGGLRGMSEPSVPIGSGGKTRDGIMYLHHAFVLAFELPPSCFFGGVLERREISLGAPK